MQTPGQREARCFSDQGLLLFIREKTRIATRMNAKNRGISLLGDAAAAEVARNDVDERDGKGADCHAHQSVDDSIAGVGLRFSIAAGGEITERADEHIDDGNHQKEREDPIGDVDDAFSEIVETPNCRGERASRRSRKSIGEHNQRHAAYQYGGGEISDFFHRGCLSGIRDGTDDRPLDFLLYY